MFLSQSKTKSVNKHINVSLYFKKDLWCVILVGNLQCYARIYSGARDYSKKKKKPSTISPKQDNPNPLVHSECKQLKVFLYLTIMI
jgi:hypothetical protein